MAVATCVLPDCRLALATFTGVVDAADILQSLDAIFGSPLWEPGFDTVWDGRQTRTLLLDLATVDRVTERSLALKPTRGDGRDAVVVERDVDFIAARLISERVRRLQQPSAGVFHKVGEAAVWLERLPTELEGLMDACAGRPTRRHAA